MPGLDVLAKQPRWAYFMMWSGMAETANPPNKLQAVFHAPNLLNRGDPPFTPNPAPMGRIVDSATPNALPDVKSLLGQLQNAAGTQTLSGQENRVEFLAAASQQVFADTGKHPAIYGAELTSTDNSKTSAQSIVGEAIRQSREKSIVSLRWLPPNPAEMQTGTNHTTGKDNGQRLLTDFEWNELMTPGTDLNQRWCVQVDAAANALKKLDEKGIPVLWTPYPEANGKQYWWAGRSGIHGSAALYRMLFDRLVNHDQIKNLVWVWEAAPAGFGPDGNGAYSDYFPGHLYTDALALKMTKPEARFRSDLFFHAFALGQVIGLYIDGQVPTPAILTNEKDWSWFVLAPQVVSSSDSSGGGGSTAALRALYADQQVVSR
jgi:mannan endo-1,4-beta-mannosidase